jgi:hypothetical protein
MAEELEQNGAVPPPGEPIHLPDPSYLPVVTAFGATIAIVGVVLSWVVCGIGLAITLVSIAKWAAATRRETAELPLEH